MKRNKTRAMAALGLLLALLPVLALADRFAVVKGGRLNLRQYPSTSSYSLGKYDTGSWVSAGAETNGWYQVRTMDGKRGYMSGSYLDFGQYNGGATVRYAQGGYVNLRNEPSLSGYIIMRVTSGSTFYIQGDYDGWCYGYVYSGGDRVYGYMSGEFLDTGTSNAVVTTRNGGKVNLRSGPSSSYKSMGSLSSGTKVKVLLRGTGWAMISANGMEGFMSTQYLSSSGSSGGTTTQTAWVNNPVSTQVLYLREKPSQSARAIGSYKNGTKVKVVSKGSTWCEVYVGTRHGYMMTRYLSFNGHYLPPDDDPVYPSYPTYPSYPSYPSYPTPTPTPLIQYITPRPTIQYITPQPTQSGPADPQAGDTITLAIGYGSSSSMINVYHDASMTQLKCSYPHGTQATMLQYGLNSCMIYVDGGVGYVSTWNVNY